MKKIKQKSKVNFDKLSEDDIQPYWSILDGWDALPFEKKCEHYWRYEYGVGGVRKLVTDEQTAK